MWWAKSESAQAWIGVRRFAWSVGEQRIVREVDSKQQALDLLRDHLGASRAKSIRVWLSSSLSQLECVNGIHGAKNRREAIAALMAARSSETDDERVELHLAVWPSAAPLWAVSITDAEVLASIEAICRRVKLSIKPWWAAVLSQDRSDTQGGELLALYDGEALLTCLRNGPGELLQTSTVPMSEIHHARRAVERRCLSLPSVPLECRHLDLTEPAHDDPHNERSFAFEPFLRCSNAF